MSSNSNIASYRKTVAGSERSFGIVFGILFLIMGLWPLVRHEPPRYWALGVALVFLAAAFLRPRILRPINRLWFKFGLLLHHIVNPIVMALLYCVAILPMGLFLKARGKDLLRLRRVPGTKSYWIVREVPGPPRGSMSKQF
jgi:hypothetical protein